MVCDPVYIAKQKREEKRKGKKYYGKKKMEKQLSQIFKISGGSRTGGMYAAGSGAGCRKHFIR